jgi:hypothetical protein
MSKDIKDLINHFNNLASQPAPKSPTKVDTGVNVAAMQASYEQAVKATKEKKYTNPEIQKELEEIREMGIVTKRLAEIRAEYVRLEQEAAQEVKQLKLDSVLATMLKNVKLKIPSKKDWKSTTSVWYGKRGKNLSKLDKSIAALYQAVTDGLTGEDSRSQLHHLCALISETTTSLQAWAVKKQDGKVDIQSRDVNHEEVKGNRRLKSDEAKQMYDNLLSLRDVLAKANFLLGKKDYRKCMHDERYKEIVRIFEVCEMTDQIYTSCKDAYKLGSKVASVTKDIIKDQVVDEAGKQVFSAVVSTIDRLGIIDGCQGLYQLYKIYKDHEREEKMMTVKGTTYSLGDDFVPKLIDSMMLELNWRTTQTAKRAAAYLASATVKAVSQGTGAEVGTLITQAAAIDSLICGLVKTFKESQKLYNGLEMLKANQADSLKVMQAVQDNSILSSYFIRLVEPELLMPPVAFAYYDLDQDAFKDVHNKKKATQLMNIMIELKQTAQTVLLGGVTTLDPLHKETLSETAFQSIVKKYDNVSLGSWKSVTKWSKLGSEASKRKKLLLLRGQNHLEVALNKIAKKMVD